MCELKNSIELQQQTQLRIKKVSRKTKINPGRGAKRKKKELKSVKRSQWIYGTNQKKCIMGTEEGEEKDKMKENILKAMKTETYKIY